MDKLMAFYKEYNLFGKENKLDLEILAPGKIKYTMPIEKKHLATPSVAHGGSVSALMDSVLGVAALTISAPNKQLVSTVEFKINFIRPAKINDVLTGIGKVLNTGKRIIITEGKIYNQKEELVAVATGTFNAYPSEKVGIII